MITTPIRDAARESMARICASLGLKRAPGDPDTPLDPLTLYPACMACGARGPRIPLWKLLAPSQIARLSPEQGRRMGLRLVCADGCAAARAELGKEHCDG